MGYGWLSYEDFANCNEQALPTTLVSAPVPTGSIHLWQNFWRYLTGTSGVTNTIILFRLNTSFEQQI